MCKVTFKKEKAIQNAHLSISEILSLVYAVERICDDVRARQPFRDEFVFHLLLFIYWK